MTTRLESSTKDAFPGTPGPHAEAAGNGFASSHAAGRLVWDIALCLGASAYVALVLFDDVEGPLLSMALIILLAYEIVRSHPSNH